MPENAAAQALHPLHRVLDVLTTLSYRSGELSAFLDQVAGGVTQLLQTDWAVVTLAHNEDNYQVLGSSSPLDDPERLYSLHGGVAGTVVRSGSQLSVEDTTLAPEHGSLPDGYRAYLGTPLRLPSDEVIGTLCIFDHQARAFGPEQLQIAGLFAERAAIAIDNYQLYQQQQHFGQQLEAEVAARTRELMAAQQALVETETLRAIGEFAAGIVHEIRSPLSSINLVLQYAARQDLDSAGRKRIDLGNSEAHRLERLLNEILLYAKPQTLQLQRLDPDPLIRAAVQRLSDLPQTGGSRIVYDGTTGSHINADADKLTQVLVNLLTNACEAAPGEAIAIELLQPGDAQLLIRVRNGGTPVPAANLERLSQPFYTTKAGGTGLGLAIVKRIVEAHHGELAITSSAENGTRVEVLLPLG